jgi:CRP-like cAMP-binding protein
MDDMETLRKQLNAECDYHMADETMDKFLDLMTEVYFKNNEAIVPYGKFDNNIYIVKSGIVRYAYFDGLKEKTFGFALPGTMMISYHSYYHREPSFFQIESCNESVVVKITRTNFDNLMKESNDFAQWMLRLSSAQLWQFEMKLAVVNGTAKERFKALIKNRPEILENVSAKIVASYIGITPQYLSKLKSEFMPDS